MDFQQRENETTVVHRDSNYKPPFSWRTVLIGHPLATSDAPHQTISKLIGLAVFGSDPLSSTAYSCQEVLVVLAAAGSGAFGYSIPIVFAIVGLLAILTISYEQTIHAYPSGGGAYIVARDNLGELPALIAAAALLTDYILTVAVSISSGAAQIVSAFPELYPFRVLLAVGMVVFIMLVNMRGVKESGFAFAIPTYYFFLMMTITIGVGLFRYFTGALGQVENPPMDLMEGTLQPVTLFLVLRAFASGTTALTGVEAISNGIMAFKEPRSKNAGITLVWMAVILGTFLIGISYLAHLVGANPSESETVFSQIARTTFGSRGFWYLAMIAATTVILIMAANTAFADFPRLGALVAEDRYLPRQLAFRGDRLVFSRGIVLLTVVASLLIIGFQASVTNLIPLYAIGVFLSFSLSQGGMAHRWWKSGHLQPGEEVKERGSIVKHDDKWKIKAIISGFGSFTTVVVAIVFAIAKFKDGAWVILLLIPALVFFFSTIYRHYRKVAARLTLAQYSEPVVLSRHRVILLVGGVHRGTLAALRYARTLSDDITAVHVAIDPEEAEKVRSKWAVWGNGVRLVMLESPYRLLLEPLLRYVEDLAGQLQKKEMITVVVPQFIPRSRWSNFLHMRTSDTLRRAFLKRKEIVITEVPYVLDE